MHEAAIGQAAADALHLFAREGLVELGNAYAAKAVNAFLKKSRLPKFPDFNVKCIPSGASGEVAWHQGTPGSICGPIRSWVTPSACTHAPEVSPPATTICRTPCWTRPAAICAMQCSTIVPAAWAPSFS